jgi:hypothetical protein
MPDEIRLEVHIGGDVNAPVNVAGHDISSVWEAAKGQPFDPPVFVIVTRFSPIG